MTVFQFFKTLTSKAIIRHQKFENKIKSNYTLDYRSLASFRVLAGALIVFDCLQRGLNYNLQSQFSILANLGVEPLEKSYLIGLILTSLISVCFVVGFRTKFFNFLLWLLATFFLFNTPVQDVALLSAKSVSGNFLDEFAFGQMLLKMFLFISVFLPLGRRWSIDNLTSEVPTRDISFKSLRGFNLILFFLCIYTFTSFPSAFSYEEWLTLDMFRLLLTPSLIAKPLGIVLGDIPFVSNIISFYFLYFSICLLPLLFFFLYKSEKLRTYICLSQIGLYLFLHFLLMLDITLLAFAILWTLGLPNYFWSRLEKTFKEKFYFLSIYKKKFEEVVVKLFPRHGRMFSFESKLTDGLMALLFGYFMIWNISVAISQNPKHNLISPKNAWTKLAYTLKLNQDWSWFSYLTPNVGGYEIRLKLDYGGGHKEEEILFVCEEYGNCPDKTVVLLKTFHTYATFKAFSSQGYEYRDDIVINRVTQSICNLNRKPQHEPQIERVRFYHHLRFGEIHQESAGINPFNIIAFTSHACS